MVQLYMLSSYENGPHLRLMLVIASMSMIWWRILDVTVLFYRRLEHHTKIATEDIEDVKEEGALG